jgi:hypothetical protein
VKAADLRSLKSQHSTINHLLPRIRALIGLAKIYGVPTFRFNEAIKRNRDRFPPDFMFQLAREEFDSLTSQNAMSKTGPGGRRTLPYALTEHRALQLQIVRISLRPKRVDYNPNVSLYLLP